MKYKICPDCLTEHKPTIKRCGCGYTWPDQEREKILDRFHGCCEYTSNGKRCHYPGTFTHSTNGTGPWLCSAHSKEQGTEFADRVVQFSNKQIINPDYSFQKRKEMVQSK